jgi:hypothetical protein
MEGRDSVPNCVSIRVVRLLVPAFNALAPAPRWVQLPDLLVPDEYDLKIKAWPTNGVGSLIYVARSSGDAINPDAAWPLMPNEVVEYGVDNAKALFVSASGNGLFVVISAEQRS